MTPLRLNIQLVNGRRAALTLSDEEQLARVLAAAMMRPNASVAVFVCVTPVDMRKQPATLALVVEQTLKRNISLRTPHTAGAPISNVAGRPTDILFTVA